MSNDNGNSRDYLSQEEIDALLNQADEPEQVDHHAADVNDYMTEIEQDALGEIGNISFGSAATALSTLLGQKVEITTPKVTVVEKENLQKEFPIPHVAVHVKYVEGFQGVNLLVIRTADAQVIADLMLGGDGTNVTGDISDLNEIHISAVQEAMNQMMGSAATSMSTIFNRMVNISPPGIDILDITSGEGTSNIPDDEEVMVKVSFRLKIGNLIDSTIMQLLTVSFSKEMVNGLVGAASEEPAAALDTGVAEADQVMDEVQQPASAPELSLEPDPAPAPTPVPERAPTPESARQQVHHHDTAAIPPRHVNVQPVAYTNFEHDESLTEGDVNLNLLMDIPLKVTVELGRTKKQVREILEFTQGSIIELDKLAGEPVDILVNDKLIAKGEVVVIDENFGVRVIDIVSHSDRLKNLK